MQTGTTRFLLKKTPVAKELVHGADTNTAKDIAKL